MLELATGAWSSGAQQQIRQGTGRESGPVTGLELHLTLPRRGRNRDHCLADTAPDGLLSNISVTSSSLQNGEAFSKYLSSLSASNWATSERHKLIVNIDDLSSGNYSASKVGVIISKFQSVVGAGNSDVEIALPMTIDKYIGNGEITAKAVKDKTVIMKDVSYREGNAKLSYMQFSKKSTEKPQTKEVMINVIPEKLGLKGVFSN